MSIMKLETMSSRIKLPAVLRTRVIWSTCQFLFGAYFSIAINMFDEQSALNSGSHVRKNSISSSIISTMFALLIRAKHNSMARRFSDTSGSLRHSTMVPRWRCIEPKSAWTTLSNVFKATYLLFIIKFYIMACLLSKKNRHQITLCSYQYLTKIDPIYWQLKP